MTYSSHFFTRTSQRDQIGFGLSDVKKVVVMQLQGNINLVLNELGSEFEVNLSNLKQP